MIPDWIIGLLGILSAITSLWALIYCVFVLKPTDEALKEGNEQLRFGLDSDKSQAKVVTAPVSSPPNQGLILPGRFISRFQDQRQFRPTA